MKLRLCFSVESFLQRRVPDVVHHRDGSGNEKGNDEMQKINEKVIRVPVEAGRIQVVDDRRADAERTGSDDCENVSGEI